MKRSWIASLLSLAASVSLGVAAEETSTAVWDGELFITGGLGWRDNVLRTGVGGENSGFFQTTVDASLMRFAENNAYWLFYFLADDIRYFNAPSVNYEQLLSATAQYVSPVGARDELGLLANYLYQHQIVDASATEQDLRRVLVLGHSLSLVPSWKRLFAKGWAFELEGLALGQVFESQLDSYWEGGAAATVSKTYGNRSEVALELESLVRAYDTREQADLDGFAVPGTKLRYSRNEASGSWRHHFDAARKWRSLSQLRYLVNLDNGSGYFDYDRALFRQRLQWRPSKWSVEGNLRLGSYHHHNQTVGDENRWRSYAVADFRIEREVWKGLSVHGIAEYEVSYSNDPRDEYESWMVGLGLGWMI